MDGYNVVVGPLILMKLGFLTSSVSDPVDPMSDGYDLSLSK